MRLEARLLLTAGLLWGSFWLLYSTGLTLWLLDIVFLVTALFLWLRRTRTVFLLASIGIVFAIIVRKADNLYVEAALNILYLGGLLFGGAQRVEARLSVPRESKPSNKWVALGIFLFLLVYAGRPVYYMVRPDKRREFLESVAPSFPVKDPAKLSPLAARLRDHVVALAGTIGERSAYQPEVQGKAKDYVVAQLRASGYSPEVLEFSPLKDKGFERRQPYCNIEAVLEGPDPWVVGAHYDSAPGTLGADDNASAVAVLLEAARLLKDRKPKRAVRFVAFDTEEPPSFGFRDMGSYRYQEHLRSQKVRIHGMISLEMLGYYNDKPGSQLHAPFLGLFYPDKGDFVFLGSDLSSAGLMMSFLKSWRRASGMPIQGVSMPSPFCIVAMSDQLNFWFGNRRGLMLCDGAFLRNPNYHQMSDSPEKLDYERMAAVTEALAGVLEGE